jgi:hypothetical protein
VDDLNDDPNNPTASSYQYILTGAEVGNIVLQTGETARKAGIFSGYYTGIDRQHLGFSEYAVTTGDFNSEWNNVYVDVVANAIAARDQAAEQRVTGITTGIAEVVRIMALGTATALWGDVPLGEAGQPDVEAPAFVNQEAAYAELQNLLDAAIVNLNAGSGRPVSGSEIYLNGDPVAWTEVANTLKARYYLHTGDYAAALSAAQNGVSSPDNELRAPHGTAAENANLNYSFFAVEVRQADLVTDDFFVSLLDPDAASNPEPANYRGHAKTDETARFNYLLSRTSFGVQPNTAAGGFAARDASAPLVTFAENLLILAEAALRSGNQEAALGHLNTYRGYLAAGGYMSDMPGADLRYEAFEAADFANGGIENPDGLSVEDALLREILQERYVTFFGQIEGFNDMRRTRGQSAVAVPVPPNVGSELPERFLYPTTEIDRNPNVPATIPGFFEPTPVNQ